jgi:hypothetical protein
MRLHSIELLFLDFRDTASQQQQQRQQEYRNIGRDAAGMLAAVGTPATAASKATLDEI